MIETEIELEKTNVRTQELGEVKLRYIYRVELHAAIEGYMLTREDANNISPCQSF